MNWHYPDKGELPNKTDDYLVCIETDKVRSIIVATYYAGAKQWYFETDLTDLPVNPTAWQYLPDPPPMEEA